MDACRSCGADVEGLSCPYCGNPTVPEPVRAPQAGARGCPRCPSPTELFRHAAGEVEVLGCPGCNGLWIPGEALEPLIEGGARFTAPSVGGDRPQSLSATVQYLKCPTCRQFMSRQNYGRVSGIILDACPGHGVWLDAGELQALRTFVASGGRRRQAAADADKARLEDDLRRLRQSNVVRDVGSGFGGWGRF